MNSFLLIAHGSRRSASNDEVRALTNRIKSDAEDQFDEVACCFLELAEPSIPDAINTLVKRGATRITLFPYFLAVGAHVAEDIPEAISEAKEQHPQVHFHILPHLGKLASIPRIILDQMNT